MSFPIDRPSDLESADYLYSSLEGELKMEGHAPIPFNAIKVNQISLSWISTWILEKYGEYPDNFFAKLYKTFFLNEEEIASWRNTRGSSVPKCSKAFAEAIKKGDILSS